MLDYRLLEALVAVVEEGGFEHAANRLYITQSAVSQRIKSLEEMIGKILITRTSPPVPTPAGYELIKHTAQVMRLESELSSDSEGKRTALSIGVNADSLETWMVPVLDDILKSDEYTLRFIVDDQEETRALLQNGAVAGCISSSDQKIQGCRMTYLGEMEYLMVSTPAFKDRWFPNGLDETSLPYAPAVLFNEKDSLHSKFLGNRFLGGTLSPPIHYMPSIDKFLKLITMGCAYGVVPRLQCETLLNSGDLVRIEDRSIWLKLYWHCWNIPSEGLSRLSEAITNGCRNSLH